MNGHSVGSDPHGNWPKCGVRSTHIASPRPPVRVCCPIPLRGWLFVLGPGKFLLPYCASRWPFELVRCTLLLMSILDITDFAPGCPSDASDDPRATTLPPHPAECLLDPKSTPSVSIYHHGAGFVSGPVRRPGMSFLEKDEQAALVAWLRFNKIKYHSVPNSAARTREQGAELKRQGLVAGVPDIYVFLPGRANIAIELKRESGILADVDALQWEWHGFLPSCPGWYSCIAFGRAAAIAFIQAVIRSVDEGLPIVTG